MTENSSTRTIDELLRNCSELGCNGWSISFQCDNALSQDDANVIVMFLKEVLKNNGIDLRESAAAYPDNDTDAIGYHIQVIPLNQESTQFCVLRSSKDIFKEITAQGRSSLLNASQNIIDAIDVACFGPKGIDESMKLYESWPDETLREFAADLDGITDDSMQRGELLERVRRAWELRVSTALLRLGPDAGRLGL